MRNTHEINRAQTQKSTISVVKQVSIQSKENRRYLKVIFCAYLHRITICLSLNNNSYIKHISYYRVVFPAIFAVFNLSYWCYYLLQEANSEGNMSN